VKDFPPNAPRWAKMAFVALWIVVTTVFVVVSIFTGDITDLLADHVGMTAVIVGGLVAFAIVVWIGWQFDRRDKGSGRPGRP
jgi:O-antigen/teichoic acid export membrane protein